METTSQLAGSSSLIRSVSSRPKLKFLIRSKMKITCLHSLVLNPILLQSNGHSSVCPSCVVNGGTFIEHYLAGFVS